jgi:hypothetical protein
MAPACVGRTLLSAAIEVGFGWKRWQCKESLQMTSILLIGLLIALATFFMLVKSRKDKPIKAKRQEKSEVLRQLLALSEQEDRISRSVPPPTKPNESRRAFVGSSRKS